jgi:hypothetical protein
MGLQNRLRAAAVGLALVIVSCATSTTSQQATSVRDGSSIQSAIILEGVTSEAEGVRAESAEIRRRFPGWHAVMQGLLPSADGRHYDVITISDGAATKDVYFDITDWYGKL